MFVDDTVGNPMAKHVVICGLAPEVVDYPRHPGLTEEKLRASLNADAANLQALGYTVEFSFNNLYLLSPQREIRNDRYDSDTILRDTDFNLNQVSKRIIGDNLVNAVGTRVV